MAECREPLVGGTRGYDEDDSRAAVTRRGPAVVAVMLALVGAAGLATSRSMAARETEDLVAIGGRNAEGKTSRNVATAEAVYPRATSERAKQARCFEQGVCVLASNANERRLTRSIANGLHEGFVFEMFEATTIEVAGPNAVESCAIATREESLKVDVDEASLGCVASVYPTSLDVHDLVVSVRDVATTHEVSIKATVKYVRREIRDLSETNRGKFLDALNVVYVSRVTRVIVARSYSVNQEQGVAMYGPNYKSIEWLVREHLYGAAQRECDHWHDDAGFLNHHIGITMQLERSIQAVDPTVAAHCACLWPLPRDTPAQTGTTRSMQKKWTIGLSR